MYLVAKQYQSSRSTFSKVHVSIVSLQALCGTRVDVPTLTGDRLVLSLHDEVIKPSTVKRIIGKGLPQSKDPSRRGDLLVSFDIVFPEKITHITRDTLRNSLPNKWSVDFILSAVRILYTYAVALFSSERRKYKKIWVHLFMRKNTYGPSATAAHSAYILFLNYYTTSSALH